MPTAARAALAAAALALATATAATPDTAQATPTRAEHVTARGTERTNATSARGKRRGHAKSHAAHHAHAAANARAHAKAHAHARLRARRGGRLHPLSTVAAADIDAPGGATLRGSHEAVDRAYDAAVRDGHPFVQSNAELARRAGAGEYVALARSTDTYRLKGVGSSYVLPATRDFVVGFAARFARECGEPLTVTSAMRPTTIRLRNSVQKSVHPTGMAVDLHAPRAACRTWMRRSLLDMETAGTIDATEEHHPPHFHVVVLRAP